MTQAQQDSKVRRRRKLRRVVLLTLLALAVVFFGWRIYVRIQIQREYEAIRSQGYPTTPEELEAWYGTVEGENAADTYIKAFAAAIEPTQEQRDLLPSLNDDVWPPPDQPLSAGQLREIDAYLAANAGALELLHKAATIESCRYPLLYETGDLLDAWLPSLHDSRAAFHALSVEAASRARSGDIRGAMHSLDALAKAVRSLEQLPSSDAALRMAVGRKRFLNSVSDVLAQADPVTVPLDRLDSMVGRVMAIDRITPLIVGERCRVLALYDDPGARRDQIGYER